MMIATHDPSFLDAWTTRTLLLRPGRGRICARAYVTARAHWWVTMPRRPAILGGSVDSRIRRNAGNCATSAQSGGNAASD